MLAQGYEKVIFQSKDGFEITADLYHSNKSAPSIVLFHQSASSRGEFRGIAPRLQKMGFNCLAVDLRWGKQDFWSKIPNETAERYGTPKIIDNYENDQAYQLDKVWPIIWKAYDDMEVSLTYLKDNGYHGRTLVLGSSFSAMLVFKLAANGHSVDGIAAFSPGEYHPSQDTLLSSWAAKVKVPVYLSAGKKEVEMVRSVENMLPDGAEVTIHHSEGRHGASVLLANEDDWPPLLNYLNQNLRMGKANGFKVLRVNRPSKSWSDGAAQKPINAWLWYPAAKNERDTLMKNLDYITHLNSIKTKEENIHSFQRIVNSFSEDSIPGKLVKNYLALVKNLFYDALPKNKNLSLVVLSGAHPIYFISLAERLAQEGYFVVSIPRTGLNKGARLPFTEQGMEEYILDLKAALDHLETVFLGQIGQSSFISWSFEGVPVLKVAMERGAKIFISLDSALGYDYVHELMTSTALFKREIPFELIHYTGLESSNGKNLNFLKEKEPRAQIDKSFDLSHGEFTSLASISLNQIRKVAVSEVYENLIQEILGRLEGYTTRNDTDGK